MHAHPSLIHHANHPPESHIALQVHLFHFIFYWKVGVFVLVPGCGAGGAVSVCCDGKLRAELPLMAAAERSEGWLYGWSHVFFLTFKGLSERAVSIQQVILFSLSNSGSLYLCDDKTEEWLKGWDKSRNSAELHVYTPPQCHQGLLHFLFIAWILVQTLIIKEAERADMTLLKSNKSSW